MMTCRTHLWTSIAKYNILTFNSLPLLIIPTVLMYLIFTANGIDNISNYLDINTSFILGWLYSLINTLVNVFSMMKKFSWKDNIARVLFLHPLFAVLFLYVTTTYIYPSVTSSSNDKIYVGM